MRNKIFILGVMLIQLSLFSQTDGFKAEKVVPFTNEEVSLKPSWIKHREELNINFLESLDPDRLLHNFRITAGLPSNAIPLEGWESPQVGLRGHFVGHYLSAVSILAEKYKNPLWIERLNYMVNELYKCQQTFGNGYLSAFPEQDFDKLETEFSGVWAPYYTYHKIMQGLLDAFVHSENKKAYDIVLNMASYIDRRMQKLNPETIEKVLYTAKANPQNEAGAMNEVLYKLYKISKNPKHLELAQIFDRDWFLSPLSQHEDILPGLHSNTHLVLVNGFAQRYNITGEPKYHDAVVNFWDILMNGHTYANGTSSGPRPNATTTTSLTAEHWGFPNHLCNTFTKEIAESCVSHNTQKLTSYLFSWTASSQYADAYMNLFYNAILPIQSYTTGAYIYHLPLGSPRKKHYLKDNDFFCCSGSSAEAYSQLNSNIYYHNDSSLWVNLYIPSEVDWQKRNVRLEQSGDFPRDTVVNFTVSTKKKSEFTLNLLLPSGVRQTDIYINNEKLSVENTSASYLKLNRVWRNKDNLKLVFHYDFHLKAMPDNKNTVAIYYGPQLLAFEINDEIILNGTQDSIIKGLSILNPKEEVFILKNSGREYRLRPLFTIDDQSYGVYATIRNY